MNQPNFLIFMTDQQRADSVYPFCRAKTPNIDQFAKEGVSFINTYCPSPHCCPSRATFFSGLYPSEHGVWNNVDVGNTLSTGLFDHVRLFSEDFAQNGYTMDYSGKWHVSSVESPLNRGFKSNFFNEVKRKTENVPRDFEWNGYQNKDAYFYEGKTGKNRLPGEISRIGYGPFVLYGECDDSAHADTNVITGIVKHDLQVLKHALDTIKNRDSSKPWLHYIGMLGPHDPYIVPKRFVDMYDINQISLPDSFEDSMRDKPAMYRRIRDIYGALSKEEHRQAVLHYLAFCSYEDYLFGLIIEQLKKSNQYENTVIVYLSDHGDYMGEHGLWAKGLPCFESAYHIPFIIGGAGLPKNKIISHTATLADFAPTILELANIQVERKFSGVSLVPFFYDKVPKNHTNDIFTQSNGNEVYGIQRSVTSEGFRYIFNAFDYDELYDMKKDPYQLHNLINEESSKPIVKKLIKKLWQFAYDHRDTCINSYIMSALAPYGPGIIFQQD